MTQTAGDRSCPLVSVLVPVHNASRYLQQCLDSVASQTCEHWEMLIVDDASTDGSRPIAEAFANREPRARLFTNDRNLGLPATLNRGLDEVRGRYVARLDADDEMLPDRLAAQVACLEAHPELGLLGAGAIIVDGDGRKKGEQRMPASDEEIRWHEAISRSSSFYHPAVTMRTEVLLKHGLRYTEWMRSAQDKRMWFDVLGHCRGANLQRPLIRYRHHENTITATRREEQTSNAEAVCMEWMHRLLGQTVDSETAMRLLDWRRPVGHHDRAAWRLAAQLLRALESQPNVDPGVIKQIRVQVGLRLLRYAPARMWAALIPREVRDILRGCGTKACVGYVLRTLSRGDNKPPKGRPLR